MRGLICKDLRLMLVQKNFFIMLPFVGFFCRPPFDSPALLVWFVPFFFPFSLC